MPSPALGPGNHIRAALAGPRSRASPLKWRVPQVRVGSHDFRSCTRWCKSPWVADPAPATVLHQLRHRSGPRASPCRSATNQILRCVLPKLPTALPDRSPPRRLDNRTATKSPSLVGAESPRLRPAVSFSWFGLWPLSKSASRLQRSHWEHCLRHRQVNIKGFAPAPPSLFTSIQPWCCLTMP